jgi:hypothetical protein
MVWAVSFETITSVGFSLRAVRDPFAEERASEIVERRESRREQLDALGVESVDATQTGYPVRRRAALGTSPKSDQESQAGKFWSRSLRAASRAGRAPFGVCRGLLVPDTFPQPTPITLASMDAR